jgi:HNH endonuclease
MSVCFCILVTSIARAMRPCIYCLEKKPDDAFNREHVIPQSFGTFSNAEEFVLDCVCRDCNSHLGKELDEVLACDSVEGLDRFLSGLKPTSEYRGLGRRSKTFATIGEGVMKGTTAYLAKNPANGELCIYPLPHVGFTQPGSYYGEVIWFRAPDVPTKEELKAGYAFKWADDSPLSIQVQGMSWEDGVALLKAKGYDKLSEPTEIPPLTGRVFTETVGQIGRTQRRAAAKIAFEYLAAVAGPGLVRCEPFHDVRNYIRHDTGKEYVYVSRNPWGVFTADGQHVPHGHYVSIHTQSSGQLIAQVSLMLRVRYVVQLTSFRFLLAVPKVNCAHFFDVTAHRAGKIPLPPLVAAEQFQKWQGTQPWKPS